jgi:hypothetical protein
MIRAIATSSALLCLLACAGNESEQQQSADTATLTSAASAATPKDTNTAEWTFMVFMNGDNDLEKFALEDFDEMARVGSSDRVNIVVQLDRHPAYSARYGNWAEARRFRVMKGMQPLAEQSESGFAKEVDMSSGATLAEFVSWARQTYPARRYALVIWDHGEGWRFFARRAGMNQDQKRRAIERFDAMSEADKGTKPPAPPPGSLVYDHPVKSVSYDMSSQRSMYNREIQNNLETLLGADDRIDVVGFDACLMAMVETGYALRRVARYMVASEELEPGTGWQYDRVLGPVVQNPEMLAEDFSRSIVDAYRATYEEDDPQTTLSAIRVDGIEQLAQSVGALGSELLRVLPVQAINIQTARDGCETYAPGHKIYNVDLDCFAQRLESAVSDASVRAAVQAVRERITRTVAARYASAHLSGPRYVSSGLAIYFPARGSLFSTDPLAVAYRNGLSASEFPVQFVDDMTWDEFIIGYAQHVK